MYLSRQLSKRQDKIKDFKTGFLPVILPVLLICALIAPANLSTALLTGATSLFLLFIGRASLKHIGLVILLAAIPIAMLIGFAKMYYNEETGKAHMKYDECWYCMPCETDCPTDAVTVNIPYLLS